MGKEVSPSRNSENGLDIVNKIIGSRMIDSFKLNSFQVQQKIKKAGKGNQKLKQQQKYKYDPTVSAIS